MAPRNAQGQRGKYLTLALSGTRNPVEDMCAIVSKFQSAKIGANSTYVRDVVHHLPKAQYRPRATYKPDGRRQDYGVLMRHAALHQLGDVTLVRSKKRRNCGPKRVKIIVTNLLEPVRAQR